MLGTASNAEQRKKILEELNAPLPSWHSPEEAAAILAAQENAAFALAAGHNSGGG